MMKIIYKKICIKGYQKNKNNSAFSVVLCLPNKYNFPKLCFFPIVNILSVVENHK